MLQQRLHTELLWLNVILVYTKLTYGQLFCYFLTIYKRLNQKMLALKKANSSDGNNSPHTSHRPAFFFGGGGGGEGGGEVYA